VFYERNTSIVKKQRDYCIHQGAIMIRGIFQSLKEQRVKDLKFDYIVILRLCFYKIKEVLEVARLRKQILTLVTLFNIPSYYI